MICKFMLIKICWINNGEISLKARRVWWFTWKRCWTYATNMLLIELEVSFSHLWCDNILSIYLTLSTSKVTSILSVNEWHVINLRCSSLALALILPLSLLRASPMLALQCYTPNPMFVTFTWVCGEVMT